jgi:hypothetical protein
VEARGTLRCYTNDRRGRGYKNACRTLVGKLYGRNSVFARSNTGIVGSNRTQGMDVCLRLRLYCPV